MTAPRYDAKVQARFFAKTRRNPENGCLEWTGAFKKQSRERRYSGGVELPYGMFWLEGKKVAAHRVARAMALNVSVESLPLIGHECDNQKCVDHQHLIDSSHSQNLQEAYDRARRNLKSLCDWWDANPIYIECSEAAQ